MAQRGSAWWYNAHMDSPIHWSADWPEIARLLIAYGLGLPVGLYREREGHTIGVRTIPLVPMASCAFVMMAVPLGHSSVDAQSRVIQGLVAGIGFIGGGAILKSEGNVHGTATAASIFNMAAVGVAVATDRIALAAVLAAINLFALYVLLPLKKRLDVEASPKGKSGAK